MDNLKNNIKQLETIINDNNTRIDMLNRINYEEKINELINKKTNLELELDYDYKYNFDICLKKLCLDRKIEKEKEDNIYENETERYKLKHKDLKEELEYKKINMVNDIKDIQIVNKNMSTKMTDLITNKNEMIKNNYESRKEYIKLLHKNKLDKKKQTQELQKYNSIIHNLYNDKDNIETKINEFINKKKLSNDLYYKLKIQIKELNNHIGKINKNIQLNLVNDLNIDDLIIKKDKYIDKLDKLLLNPDNNIIEIYNEYDKEIYKYNKELQDLDDNILKIKMLLNYQKKNITIKPLLIINKNTKLINIKRDICNYKNLINKNINLIIQINYNIDDLDLFYMDLFSKELKYEENCIKRKEISTKRINKKYDELKLKLEEKYKLDESVFDETKKKIYKLTYTINKTRCEMNIQKRDNELEIEKLKKENNLKKKQIINIKIDMENLK